MHYRTRKLNFTKEAIPKPVKGKVAGPGSPMYKITLAVFRNQGPGCLHGISPENDIDEARRRLIFDSSASPISSNPPSWLHRSFHAYLFDQRTKSLLLTQTSTFDFHVFLYAFIGVHAHWQINLSLFRFTQWRLSTTTHAPAHPSWLFSTLNSFRSDNSAATFSFIAFEMVYILSTSSGAPSCNEVVFPSAWSCMLFLAPDLTCLI